MKTKTGSRSQSSDDVNVWPTKHFFVEMLTRDINLTDAILDLLDNCVDGVRRLKNTRGDQAYKGHFAHIEFSEDEFKITDNCGGIPRDAAANYAFMFGRPQSAPMRHDGSIGLVGIGMKRAMFKMGRNCLVHSHHADDTFDVHISPHWLRDDENWKLKLVPVEARVKQYGTSIQVTELRNSVQEVFTPGSFFIDELPKKIGEAFGLLIQRGFEVKVNNLKVKSAVPHLLWEVGSKSKKEVIRPYVYRDTIDGVEVFLAFGFREADIEADSDRQTLGYQSQQAGWTVACNDRVVLAHDKTALTGWGASGAPQYHGQFSAMAGVLV